MTFQLNYRGRVNDCTGDRVRNDRGRVLVVTEQIYDPNEDKTTLVLEPVE